MDLSQGKSSRTDYVLLSGIRELLTTSLSETCTNSPQVYDIDGDGYLNKSDLFQLLKSSLRPAIAKAIPYGQNRGVAEATPAASPRSPFLSKGHTEEGDNKEAELDLVDEEKLSGMLRW